LFRAADYMIVSDACVACRGPVLSVKLHFRVPPAEVRSVALDEGSRTSSALTQILLAELHGVAPRFEPLAIGSGLESTAADAVLLIGDRAMRRTEDAFCEVWDLGQKWTEWTSLPFVFATWIARAGVDTAEVAALLAAARDNGVRHLADIAAAEAAAVGIPVELASSYLRENLHFTLGPAERDGLTRFHELCIGHQLASRRSTPFFKPRVTNDCNVR
jgi:chorismate dehydratase